MNGLFDGIGDTLGGFFGAGAQPAQAPQTQETPAGATQVAAGPQPGLIEQWKNYLQDPSVRAGLMSMGTALLGGARPGESAGAFVGRSLQSGGAGAGAFQQQEEALRAAKEQERLKQAQIDEQGAARRYSADQAFEGRMFTAEQNRLGREFSARERAKDRALATQTKTDTGMERDYKKAVRDLNKEMRTKYVADLTLKPGERQVDPLGGVTKMHPDDISKLYKRERDALDALYGKKPTTPTPSVQPAAQPQTGKPATRLFTPAELLRDRQRFEGLVARGQEAAILQRTTPEGRIIIKKLIDDVKRKLAAGTPGAPMPAALEQEASP